MEWRALLGAVSGAGLVVGAVASIALIPWMRLFFGTLAVAMAGVAAGGSLVVWERPESLWFVVAGLGFAVAGFLLLRWGRATDQRPGPSAPDGPTHPSQLWGRSPVSLRGAVRARWSWLGSGAARIGGRAHRASERRPS